MKLESNHIVAIIIAVITLLGSILTAIIVNNKNHDGNDKIENKNLITVDIDNKQPSVKETNSKNKMTNFNCLDMISTLEKLKTEGNDILKNYNQRKKDFNAWKSNCKGILKETDSEIDIKIQNIENEGTTFDYHSQIIKIMELLDSEIINQKTKSK